MAKKEIQIADKKTLDSALSRLDTVEVKLKEPSGVTAGTYRSVTVDEKGRVVAGSNPNSGVAAGTYDSVTVNAQGYVTSGSNPTRATAGTYKSVTVNAQGYVTGGSNPTTLAGYGITNTIPVVVSTTAPADTTALWIS